MDQNIRLTDEPVFGSSNPACIETSPGGSALNSASIAAALGMNAKLVSPVGADANGSLLNDVCTERGIESGLSIEPGSTGVYSAIFKPDGDLVIGTADLSIYERINREWLKKNVQSQGKPGTGLFLTSNLSEDLLETACERFDYIVAATISPAKAPRLRSILNRLELLFTNHTEACALLGLRDDKGNMSGEKLTALLHEAGAKSGIISNGREELWAWEDRQTMSLTPATPGTIADVNGAGDALAAACLAALSRGLSLHDCARYAMEVAASTLTHKGPYPETLDNLPAPPCLHHLPRTIQHDE